MAHQAHNLPWTNISSHLRYADKTRKAGWRTHLRTEDDKRQGKDLEHFARVFASTIKDFSDTANPTAPTLDEGTDDNLVVDAQIATSIRISLDYLKRHHQKRSSTWCGCCCPFRFHDHRHPQHGCQTPISDDPYTLSYWQTFFACPACCKRVGWDMIITLIKAMLIHGSTAPLLRLAARSDIKIGSLWKFGDGGGHLGWKRVASAALFPYIALNVIFSKQELPIDERSETRVDYRLTAFYQQAVFQATKCDSQSDIETLPHRTFFGIPVAGQDMPKEQFGLLDLSEYLARTPYTATTQDVNTTRQLLCSKYDLPAELSNHILTLANYIPQRRLQINDPLDPINGEELRKYLSYCWNLLIRCDLLATACGYKIDWEGEVHTCLAALLWPCEGMNRRYCWVSSEEYDERRANEMRWLSSTLYHFT